MILKLQQTFVNQVGEAVQEVGELLKAVTNLKVKRNIYEIWTACIGTFMQKLGAEKFF